TRLVSNVTPVGPTTPDRDEVTQEWVLTSKWQGATGWVSIAPNILGRTLDGDPVSFFSEEISGTAEVISVITPAADRAYELLKAVAEQEVMTIDWSGGFDAFDRQEGPNWAEAFQVEGGVKVCCYDNKGEVPAAMG